MLLTIGGVMIALWLVGCLVLKGASGLIHELIPFAVGAYILHLFRENRTA